MKKWIVMLLVLALAVCFVACGDKPAEMPEEDMPAVMPEVDVEEETEIEIEYMPEEKLNELSALMDQLVANINDEMMVGTVEITSDAYNYYGIPETEGAYAVVSMPMINAIAHEVVLVELPEGADAEAIVADMEELQDPMKWVCVQPETSWVRTNGKYVVGVMTTEAMAEAISANFDTIFGA